MTVNELINALAFYPRNTEVKVSLGEGSIGGADMTVEPSEDWPNAVVIFAEKETA